MIEVAVRRLAALAALFASACGGQVGQQTAACDACSGTCTSGRCLVTLVSESNVGTVTADSTNVYWSAADTGVLASIPAGGGVVTTLATGMYGSQLALESGTIYWASYYSKTTSALVSVAVGGGDVTTLVSTSLPMSGYLAMDATSVYWTAQGSVLKSPVAGGSVVTLVTRSDDASSIVVSATGVYWCAGKDGSYLLSIPLEGGHVTTLAADIAWTPAVVGDATNLYWADQGQGTVMSVPQAGGATTTLATGVVNAMNVAVDDTSVYWTSGDGETGIVAKVPIRGGAVVTLATGQLSPVAIAVDATSVYWANTGGAVSTIMKLTPK
jgi:hypothetical protein